LNSRCALARLSLSAWLGLQFAAESLKQFRRLLLFYAREMNTPTRLVSHFLMKHTRVVVPWKEGLHLRPAAKLVQMARASKSVIFLKVGKKVANARSIFAILLLCASTGMVIDLQVSGDDEETVFTSIYGRV